MRNQFLNFLHFTRKERNGTLLLLFLCIVVFSVPTISRWLQPKEATDFSDFRTAIAAFRDSMKTREQQPVGEPFYFDPNNATAEDFVQLGLSEKLASMICRYREKGGKFRQPEDFKKIWGLAGEDYERLLPFMKIGKSGDKVTQNNFSNKKTERFNFDPNVTSDEEFSRLGLPEWTINSIVKYRAKGGRFRRKEDFKKIYNLSEEDFSRLEPYIVFSSPVAANSNSASYQESNYATPKWAVSKSVDINRADVQAWMNLPGIGEKRAQQLVNYREKLGGFLSIEQVAQLYSLPDSIFQKIRSMLVLETRDVRRIDLNTVSAAELANHPYFSKKQADLIVRYREQHGPYTSVDGIDQIIAFTDKAWLGKVKGYLKVE